MKLKVLLAAALISATGATALMAANEPQVERQNLMKNNGAATGVLAKMIKGETPYDQAKAMEALKAMNADIKAFPNYFPAGSETGFDTDASPKIWENMDDFKAKAAKMEKDTAEAIAANPADLDALKPHFAAITQNCGGCHEAYRLKKS